MTPDEPVAGRRAVVVAAGRLLMDVMQTDWEPLSHCELEQRLDQTVEEILEAELMSGVQGQGRSGCVFEAIPDTSAHTVTSHTSAPAAEGEPESENLQCVMEIEQNPAVQCIMSLLQKLKWSESPRRLTGRSRLSLSHTVFLSLTLLSARLSFRSVSSTFRLEKGNIHRIFFSFCRRVNELQGQIIRWPTGQEACDLLLPFSSWLGWDEKFEQKGLPKVLGVLGHTRVPVRLPASKRDTEGGTAPRAKRLRGRLGPDSWLNLELACDTKGRFIHCSVSQGSSRNPGEALSQRLAQHPELLPPGSCFLARAGYPLTQHILTPFRPARNPQENLYNRAVETHLRRLERAVAHLKERFGRLRRLDVGECERAEAVVLTCCILHNALLHPTRTPAGQVEDHAGADAREEEGEGPKEEAGVKLRETVTNLLYSWGGESGAESREKRTVNSICDH